MHFSLYCPSFLFLLFSVFHPLIGYSTVTAKILLVNLFFPPELRLKLPGGEENLRTECEKAIPLSYSYWEKEATHGYQIAKILFRTIIENQRQVELDDCNKNSSSVIWFPFFSGNIQVLEGLVKIINENYFRLGLKSTAASVLSWPQLPCSGIRILWERKSFPNKFEESKKSNYFMNYDNSFEDKKNAAVKATERWVGDTLCRLKLCPYTASLDRAAIGLEAAQVSPGPIRIRHYSESLARRENNLKFKSVSTAAILSFLFWEGVSEIAETPEEEFATSLLIAPPFYDDDFMEFAATCDDLIEKSVQVVKGDTIVGRAWFHPKYNATAIGHKTIIAGHALPANIVQDFVQDQVRDKKGIPNFEEIKRANDAVRWTPHATINLLRRSQLTAAKEVEAEMPNIRPNAVYVRNILKILTSTVLK